VALGRIAKASQDHSRGAWPGTGIRGEVKMLLPADRKVTSKLAQLLRSCIVLDCSADGGGRTARVLQSEALSEEL
jgi:hypothetical protein